MARTSRRVEATFALLLLLLPLAQGQLSNLPNLPGASSSAAPGNGNGNGGGNGVNHLPGLPTLPGASVPTLIIPDTANAPFMRKSSLPEGTFFIAVGATLAFLGACVLFWRAMVAWSINRSVKRTAVASVGTNSEKMGHGSSYGGWGGSRKSSGFHKSSFYKNGDANSVSMENLTSAGKQVKPHFRDSGSERPGSLPQDLFFSPTAHARDTSVSTQRASGYMPAGYYPTPSSQPAGGAANTTIGASLSPYAQDQRRKSNLGGQFDRTSPPRSPEHPTRGSTMARGASREDPLNSRDGGARMSSRDPRSNYHYANPSSSSLMVGQSSNGSEPTSRAPSAYLEDLFENHGNGPRERY